MLLAIDIGNTNIVIGGLCWGEILFKTRISTDYARTQDEYSVMLSAMLRQHGVGLEAVEDCIVSSVVPPVLAAVCGGVARFTGKRPMVMGPELETGLTLCVDAPSKVGSDRIVAVVAALEEHPPPLILMDLGTATTMDVVEPGGRYLGGVIIPGVRISLDALTSRAAQLPEIGLDRPARVIGKNTVEGMHSGVLYGAAAMIDGLTERMEEELGHGCTLVATGGIAPFIIPLCKREIALEQDLLLKGLGIIYRKNKP